MEGDALLCSLLAKPKRPRFYYTTTWSALHEFERHEGTKKPPISA